MEKLLKEREVAALLSVSVRAIQDWRQKGIGPVYVKLGHLVRYRPSDIETWLKEQNAPSSEGR